MANLGVSQWSRPGSALLASYLGFAAHFAQGENDGGFEEASFIEVMQEGVTKAASNLGIILRPVEKFLPCQSQ